MQPLAGEAYHQWKGEQIPDGGDITGGTFSPHIYKYGYSITPSYH
jgi:hypothetical protein